MQPTLFEEIQEEAKFRVQEIEEQMTVLRQDVERTRELAGEGTGPPAEGRAAQAVPDSGSAGAAPGADVPRPGHCGGRAAMSQTDTAHAWWSRLRHQGLLLSPVVMVERFPAAPEPAPFPALPKLRDAYTRFDRTAKLGKTRRERDQAAILGLDRCPAGELTSATGKPTRQAAQHPGEPHRRRAHRQSLRHDSPASGRLCRRRGHDARRCW